MDSLSSDELRKKISELTQVLIRIEDNARRLDEGLRKIYSQHIEK